MNKISRELGCARETIADLLAEVPLPEPLDPGHPSRSRHWPAWGTRPWATTWPRTRSAPAPLGWPDALGHSVPWLRIRARRDGMEHRLAIPPSAVRRRPSDRATDLARQAGFADLPSYLRHRYETDGLSMQDIHAETGLQNSRVTALLGQACVQRRTDRSPPTVRLGSERAG